VTTGEPIPGGTAPGTAVPAPGTGAPHGGHRPVHGADPTPVPAPPGAVPPAGPVPPVVPPAGVPVPGAGAPDPPADPAPPDPTELTGIGPATVGPAAPAPAAATAAAGPAAAPVPTPAAQLALRIVPLRREADGTHRLTVHLHPVELGPVSLVAEVHGDDIRLQLAGGTEHGQHALREALPELRRELERAGFTGCTLDLRQDSAPDTGRQRYPQPGTGQPHGGTGEGTGGGTGPVRPARADPPPVPPRPVPTHALDLQL